jgi:hypothetical protein
MSINLNDRLVRTSKKFAKACDQIKLLKTRIAELIAVFTYCDPTVVNNSNTNNNSNNIFNNNFDNRNYSSYNNNNNNNNSLNGSNRNDYVNDYNVNLFKESIRQQIENLQSIKTAYFMYAHHKADEITKLQCEIYGEAAVREAYEQAPASVLIAASASDDQNSLTDEQTDEMNDSTNSDDYNDNDNNPWSLWNTQQEQNEHQHFDQSQAQSHQTSNQNQLQSIEYDFLTA